VYFFLVFSNFHRETGAATTVALEDAGIIVILLLLLLPSLFSVFKEERKIAFYFRV